MKKSYHGQKTICLDFISEKHYQDSLQRQSKFKTHLESYVQTCPELFPAEITDGWILYGYKHSNKHNYT